MKTVENLVKGEVLMMDIKKVKGGKLQIQFAEIVRDPNKAIDAVGMFNSSDERFTPPKARRAWLTVEPGDAIKHLPAIKSQVELAEKSDGEDSFDINILNPSVAGGDRLRLQVRETTIPTQWQIENKEKAAKLAPSSGRYLFHNGQNIYSRATVVVGNPSHIFLATTETSEFLNGDDLVQTQNLIEPQEVEETVASESKDSKK